MNVTTYTLSSTPTVAKAPRGRKALKINVMGKYFTLEQISEIFGINKRTLYSRIFVYGYPVMHALAPTHKLAAFKVPARCASVRAF